MCVPKTVKFGWRFSRTTTSSGTKKIRRIVSEFGRFIGHRRPPTPPPAAYSGLESHYRLRIGARQRHDFRVLAICHSDEYHPGSPHKVTTSAHHCPKPVQIQELVKSYPLT